MNALSSEVRASMWCDLLQSELTAVSARHTVTRRALNYLAGGLALDQVLDAFKIDEAAWGARVVEYEAWVAENRAAARRLEQRVVAS